MSVYLRSTLSRSKTIRSSRYSMWETSICLFSYRNVGLRFEAPLTGINIPFHIIVYTVHTPLFHRQKSSHKGLQSHTIMQELFGASMKISKKISVRKMLQYYIFVASIAVCIHFCLVDAGSPGGIPTPGFLHMFFGRTKLNRYWR